MFTKPGYKKLIIVLLSLCCTGLQLNAAKRYWISASTSGWNSTANWSSTSGGSGGSSVPGSSDTCYFDGSGLGNCDIDANVNVKRFETVSGYTGTISQNAYTITVGTGGMKVAGGVFTGSASGITLSSTFENSGCAFTSTSGTFEIKEGHFSLTGTGAFLHNNGLVKFFHGTGAGNDTCRITLSTSSSDKQFYDVEMNSATSWHRYYKFPSGGMRVNHTLTTAGGGNKYIGAGTVELMGDYTNSAGHVGSGGLPAGTLKFMGTGNQTLTGSGASTVNKVVNIDIDKSSGTLNLVGTIATTFDLKRTNGSINAGTSRWYYGAVTNGTKVTGNFTGSNSLNKLYFIGSNSSTLTIEDTLQVNDSLVFGRTSPIAKGTNAGILCAKGHITIAGNFFVTGTMTLLVKGSGKQVYKSGVIYDFNRLQGSPNIKIEKDITDTLKIEGFHPIQTAFTHVSGVVNSDLAHIKFSAVNQPVITGSVCLQNVEFCYSSTTASHAITIASGTELGVADSLIISGTGGSSNLLNTGTVQVKGNMYISCNSTGNAGTASIKVMGTGNQHIYGFTGSGTQGRLPNLEIDKASGTLYLHNTICMGSSATANSFTHTQGTIDYGTSTFIFANNCNITSTVSGNRLELYNVQFTTGTINIQGATTLVVNNDLSTSASSSALTINGNTIECKGDMTVNNTNASIASAGTVSMIINGTGNQVFTGSGVSATGYLPKITINKTAGTLYLASIISAGNDWTYTAGTVDASTYTGKVYFGGTHNIDAQGTSSTMRFYDATFAGTSTQTGDLDVQNNLVINASSTLAQGSYALGFGGYANNGTHSGSGAVSFVGSGYNTFTKSGGGNTNFANVTVNRSGGSLTLASPVTITAALTLTKGVIKTSSTNLLKFADNATGSEGSDSAYIRGPVQKTGNEAFLFALGDTAVSGSGKYHPLKITAPSSATDAFTANYIASGQTHGSAVDTLAIDSLSSCQHWTVSRDAGTSQVKVKVYWNNDCGLSADANDMRFVQWDGTTWMSIGDEVTGNSISSKNTLNTFGSFTLAQGHCSVLQKLNPVKVSGLVTQKSNAATSDGSVTLSVSGGNAPYTYNWSSGPATAAVSGLSAGIYQVTVTDNYGCEAKKYFFIGSKGATNTYTLTTGSLTGIDATVMIGQDGLSRANSNFGSIANFDAAYVNDGINYIQRSFLRFDFSSLPLNTIVNSATLNLYGGGNNISTANNRSILKRVGSKWEEHLLTWNNQPYAYNSDSLSVDSTMLASRNYSINVLAHVQKMVANPFGNNGWMLSLANENSALPAALNFASSDNTTSGAQPGIVISITIPDDCDQDRNWVQTTTFGEEGEITSQSKSFMDNLGRSTQDQARILSSGLIMASQTMYDAFGRPVGSTLPAPTYTNSLCFKTNFMVDDSSNAYTYNDFDKPVTGSNLTGELNNPMGVDNSTQGTVGWYYSNNNTEEPFVAATSFPYSRVQYTNDPTGRVWKASSVDTMFRMGSGHETKTFIMPSAGELDYLFGYRGTYNQSESFGDVGQYKSENLLLYKSLSVNADGKEAISYTNSSGQLIASCVSGSGGACDVQIVSQPIRYVDNGYTTLHIPKSQNNSVELPVACAVCIANDPSLVGTNLNYSILYGDATTDVRVLYKLQNAETGTFLTEGTDYTLNRNTRKLTFINTYDSMSLVLNIAYDVVQVYKTQTFLTAPPELTIKYKMDYNQWSLNYYDLKGRLVSSIAPNDINCSDYFQGSASAIEATKNDFYSISCMTSAITAGREFTTHPATYSSPGMKQDVTITLYPSYEDPGLNSRFINPLDTLLFNRSLPVASFGRFADSTQVIDSTTFKTRSLEWLNNDLSKAYVSPVYGDSIVVYDTSGVAIDTLVDSLAARLFSVGHYMEFGITADIGFKSTFGGNYVYQQQERTFKYRLSYDEQLNMYAILPDPNNTVDYYIPESIVDTIEDIGIKFEGKYLRFEGYPNLDPAVKYDLCTIPSIPPDTNISYPQWNAIINIYTNFLRVNYKAVINNYYADGAPQVATTKIKYDTYNRVVQSISQDEGQSDVIYDDEGKVRFTQNDLQRTAGLGGRFSYVNYDKRGRVVESGEYDPNISNGSVTKLYFQTQAQFDAGTNVPPSGSGSLIWIKNDLDNIDAPRKKCKSGVIYDFPQGDVPSVAGASPAYTQRNTHGRISKAWNEHGATWYNYDERGALTWTVQSITGLGNKTYNYVTSLFGKLEQTQYQKESSSERLFHRYEYDSDARLTASYASTDGGSSWTALAHNEYYQHGPLKRMELGHKLQGLDYVYTVGGALKSINDPYLTAADPGADGFSGDHSAVNQDVFGYSIDYYADDYKRDGTGIQTYNGSNFSGDNDSYAGIIKSVRWRTVLPSGATNNYGTSTLMQEYSYDFNYQLTDALFTPVAHNSGSVPSNTVQPTTHHDPAHSHYSYAYGVSDITYDLNGNIQTLKRNPYVVLDAGVSPSDNLTYHYSSTLKNRLTSVSDAAGTSTGTETDFPNQGANNYSYDVIGQLTTDTKDGLTYEYNFDGLTRNIKQGGVIRAAFEYNHLGLRQRKITYAGGEPSTYTWYVYDPGGALVSTYITDVGNSTTTQEDMPLYAGGRIGMLNKTTGRYAFELSDHLGNVRSVIAKNTSSNAVEVLSYSDYYPHGGVLPGRNFVSSPAYKLGYQGQEKDGETNFYNFELRQFDPRLGRWFNPDPMGQYYSPYLAMGNDPVSGIDPTGGWTETDGEAGWDRYWSSMAGIENRFNQFDSYAHSDGFFAMDRHRMETTDYSNSGEILQGYFNSKENFLVNMHNALNPERSRQSAPNAEQLSKECPECTGNMLPELTIHRSTGKASYNLHQEVQRNLDRIDAVYSVIGGYGSELSNSIGSFMRKGIDKSNVSFTRTITAPKQIILMYENNFYDHYEVNMQFSQQDGVQKTINSNLTVDLYEGNKGVDASINAGPYRVNVNPNNPGSMTYSVGAGDGYRFGFGMNSEAKYTFSTQFRDGKTGLGVSLNIVGRGGGITIGAPVAVGASIAAPYAIPAILGGLQKMLTSPGFQY